MMSPQSILEREALDEFERRLAGQGYMLQREPRGVMLPDFLGKFQPDAIATGREPNLVIEVITGRGSGEVEKTKVRQLQTLLDGHPDWKLEILYTTSSTPFPVVASMEAIQRRFAQVRQLADTDGPAALILAWSLLEAVARTVLPERAARGLTPAATVELLTSMGHIEQSEANALQAAARARNLIVHGDVGQQVPPDQLDSVLDIIENLLQTLSAKRLGRPNAQT